MRRNYFVITGGSCDLGYVLTWAEHESIIVQNITQGFHAGQTPIDFCFSVILKTPEPTTSQDLRDRLFHYYPNTKVVVS